MSRRRGVMGRRRRVVVMMACAGRRRGSGRVVMVAVAVLAAGHPGRVMMVMASVGGAAARMVASAGTPNLNRALANAQAEIGAIDLVRDRHVDVDTKDPAKAYSYDYATLANITSVYDWDISAAFVQAREVVTKGIIILERTISRA